MKESEEQYLLSTDAGKNSREEERTGKPVKLSIHCYLSIAVVFSTNHDMEDYLLDMTERGNADFVRKTENEIKEHFSKGFGSVETESLKRVMKQVAEYMEERG